jgi:surface polysaccharide O-acyltransferase-like enzyme
MVVGIHSNVYFLAQAKGTPQWFIIMLMTALCLVSVPLFFMVSGAGNLVKDEITSLSNLYKVKIPKVFIPFVIWSLIYVFARIAIGKLDASPMVFWSLLWEPAYYQFWFMYSLLGMYLCIPIFQYLIIKSNKRLIQYIIILWFITSVIIPMVERYIPEFRLSSHFNFIFLEGYWGYFLLGGYLRKYPIKKPRKYGLILLFSGIALTFVSAVLEWYFTPTDKYYGYVYSSYLLPGAVFMSVGAFLYLQDIHIKTSRQPVIYYLSGLTMGVYYVHLMIVSASEMAFKSIQPTAINSILKLVAIVAISTVICMALKQIKPLRRFLL